MNRLFDDLKDGLNEMIAHKKGKITLPSEIIEAPEPPTIYTPSTSDEIIEKVVVIEPLYLYTKKN